MWKAGVFSSLKLAEQFFRSDSAARIFETVYGIKPCKVNLGALEAKASPIIGSEMGSLPVIKREWVREKLEMFRKWPKIREIPKKKNLKSIFSVLRVSSGGAKI